MTNGEIIEFMKISNAESGSVFGAKGNPNSKPRFDLSNLHVQNYGDTLDASYTLLIGTSSSEGLKVISHNESRVMVKLDGNWKVAHMYKFPAWQAPHTT